MRSIENNINLYRHPSDTFEIGVVNRSQTAKIKIAIAASRFNQNITSSLYDSTYSRLIELGVREENIHTAWCPGAFEIPLLAKSLAMPKQYNAIIALGAVIRGETWHFELVANQCAAGIMQVALESETPIIFSVLATDNVQQALARSSANSFDTGSVAAESAIEMSLKLIKTKN